MDPSDTGKTVATEVRWLLADEGDDPGTASVTTSIEGRISAAGQLAEPRVRWRNSGDTEWHDWEPGPETPSEESVAKAVRQLGPILATD